jgi:negative regulator of flagellin synthesis FlgM
MQVNSLQSVNAAQSLSRVNSVKTPTTPATAVPASIGDQLDLSPEAQQILSSQATGGTSADFRADKVASIRQAIADGTYETPEKLSSALDKLLDSFA